MEIPSRNPRRIQSYNSMGSYQVPKQYRVLGLAPKASSVFTTTNSIISTSTSSANTTFIQPQVATIRTLSDNLSILIPNIILYFDLFPRLPPTLIDRNLRMERPTDTFNAYHILETQFSKCLLGLRDTLWSIQTQLKDENAFVRKLFATFGHQINKYLTRCLKGWRGLIIIRSCARHYRAVASLRRILRKELEDMKEIMDAVGPHCKDMLLNVDVEVIGEWIVNLEPKIVVSMGETCPRVDLRIENPGLSMEDSGLMVSSPTESERSMEKLFRLYRLPTYSFTSNRTSTSVSDSEMDRDFAKGKKRRRSFLRASLLTLN